MKLSHQKIKIVTTGALVGLNLLVLTAGSLVFAQTTVVEPGRIGTGVTGIKVAQHTDTVGNLLDLVGRVIKYTYVLFFTVAVFFILLAAFNYLTAAGDAEKVGKAKNMIIYAVIAIVVAILAVSFETIIGNFISA